MANSVANTEKPMANKGDDMANGMANVVTTTHLLTSQRVGKTYRYRDPEGRRSYMKEYMRKRRANE